MIQAQELRIGNLLIFRNLIEKDRIITVDGRFFFALRNNNVISEYYQPILLTEEWHLAISTEYVFEQDGSFAYVELISKGLPLKLEIKFELIKYVHLWQNFYFALAGEELNINYEI